MSFSTVLIISLAAGVILIVGGGLMMYMANLVKSAYEIKVQINTEVEERLSKMGDDLEKKSRWIKRDLIEEIEKVKGNLLTENSAKLTELAAPLMGRIEALEAQLKTERADWMKAVESDRQAIASLDAKLKGAAKAAGKPLEKDQSAGAAMLEQALAARDAGHQAPPAPPSAQPSPGSAAKPAEPGPQPA